MHKSKILSSFLLFSLLLSFAGCTASENSDVSTDKAVQTENGTTDESVSESNSSEYTIPLVDYNGAEFTFMDTHVEGGSWLAQSYNDFYAENVNGEPINDAQYKRKMQVEEELNIKLDKYFTEKSKHAEQLKKFVLANEDVFDVAYMGGTQMASVIAEPSMLVDLYEIETLNTDALWWDKGSVEAIELNGKLNGITGDISLYSMFAPVMLFFNQQLLDTLHLENLYDLVREKGWTFDKCYEMCRAAAADLNGDGEMTEVDRYGMGVQPARVCALLLAGDERIIEKDSDGMPKLRINNERAASIVEWSLEFLTNSDVNMNSTLYPNYKNSFAELRIPMFLGDRLLFEYNQLLAAFEMRSMEAEFGIIPTPLWDETQEEYRTMQNMTWASFICVPMTNTDLDMTGYVLDAIGYYSQKYVTPAYYETTVRTKALRSEDSEEMLDIILSNRVYDTIQFYNWGKIESSLNTLYAYPEKNFTSLYAGIESTVLADMQKTLDLLAE